MTSITTKKKFLTEAANILNEHSFSCLASGKESSIWLCSKNNSSFYAFTISITPYGISVMGDIGDFLFPVYNRDLSFLAGNDVEYYIHSKLSEDSKKTFFNDVRCKEFFISEFFYFIENSEDIEKYFSNDELKKVFSFIEENKISNELDLVKIKKFFYSFDNQDISDFFLLLFDIEDEYSYYDFLKEQSLLNLDDCDANFFEPTDNLIQSLYIINLAAKKILKNYLK